MRVYDCIEENDTAYIIMELLRGKTAKQLLKENGALSFSGMLLSLYGFYVGMRSFEEKEVSPTWSVIGAIASGVVAVGYLTLFLTGIG